MSATILYRYESYATELGTRVELTEWRIIKETTSGYWIARVGPYFSDYGKKWMKKTKRHPFAVTDKEAARVSFVRRKWHQIEILKGQLSRARSALCKLQNEEEMQQHRERENWASLAL